MDHPPFQFVRTPFRRIAEVKIFRVKAIKRAVTARGHCGRGQCRRIMRNVKIGLYALCCGDETTGEGAETPISERSPAGCSEGARERDLRCAANTPLPPRTKVEPPHTPARLRENVLVEKVYEIHRARGNNCHLEACLEECLRLLDHAG